MPRLVKLLIFATAVQLTGAAEPYVEFFPQELYLNEPATFGLSAAPGTPVKIQHNGNDLFSGKFSDKTLEVSTTFISPGPVIITCGSQVFRFQLVGPETDTPLHMKDGYMYTGSTPVILGIEHKHPPKHDRTWEVLNIVKTLSSKPSLPVVESLQILSGSSELKHSLENAGCSQVSTLPASVKGVHEIDHLIVQSRTLKKSDLNLGVLKDRDLNLGLTQKRLRMRLEWLLQACSDKGPFMLTSISLSRTGRSHHGNVNHHIKLAALSNNSVYLPIPVDTDEAEVNSYIIKQLKTKVVLK